MFFKHHKQGARKKTQEKKKEDYDILSQFF
jgi:hypothetical protein